MTVYSHTGQDIGGEESKLDLIISLSRAAREFKTALEEELGRDIWEKDEETFRGRFEAIRLRNVRILDLADYRSGNWPLTQLVEIEEIGAKDITLYLKDFLDVLSDVLPIGHLAAKTLLCDNSDRTPYLFSRLRRNPAFFPGRS